MDDENNSSSVSQDVGSLVTLVRSITEYYTLKQGFGLTPIDEQMKVYQSKLEGIEEPGEVEDDNLVPPDVDGAVEKAFLKQLQRLC